MKTKAYEVWCNWMGMPKEKKGVRKAVLCMTEAELRIFALGMVERFWPEENQDVEIRRIMAEAVKD